MKSVSGRARSALKLICATRPRISKRGDKAMRSLLVESASTLIRNVKRFSALKSWAIRLAGRKGFRKAAIATARKIAVLMLTLWKTETDFQWTKEAKS